MKCTAFIIAAQVVLTASVFAQSNDLQKQKELHTLIDHYSRARETRDTFLLKAILTEDIDQLVSNGEWRTGIQAAVQGMLKSSANNPGARTLRVERIKALGQQTALIDCRYQILNQDGSNRMMWSSFTAVLQKGKWKISAIRNMMPVAN